MNKTVVSVCFWISLLILSILSVQTNVLNLNAFILFIYLVFYSFVNYKSLRPMNIIHGSWMAVTLSLAFYFNDFVSQVLLVSIVPATLIVDEIIHKKMKKFVVVQITSLFLFFVALGLYFYADISSSILVLLIALFIRQVQFPFHFWIKEVNLNVENFPSILFFVIIQSGFILYAHEHIQYPQAMFILSLIPIVTLITGILTAVSALREKNSLTRHLLLIISQSCLPLAAYNSYNETSATGGILFSLVLAIAGSIFGLIAFQIYKQKGIVTLSKNYSLYRANKNLGLIYLVSGLSMVGLPFTLGFFAEDILFHGLIETAPSFAVIYILVTAINAYTVFQTFNTIFFGHTQTKWSPLYVNRTNKVFIGISFLIITFSGFFSGYIASSVEHRLIENNSARITYFRKINE